MLHKRNVDDWMMAVINLTREAHRKDRKTIKVATVVQNLHMHFKLVCCY